MTPVTYTDKNVTPTGRVTSVLVISKYARSLNTSDRENVLLYHSLFGNIHSIAQQYTNILYFFERPHSVDQFLGGRSDAEEVREIIDLFVDNYFLVPEGFDERELVNRELVDRSKSLETGKLINAVQLNVSEGCNLKCTYCFADRVDERASAGNFAARNEQKFMSVEMALQSIEAVESLIRKNGGSAMVIKFFGREPLLNWPVVEAVLDRCEAVTDSDGFKFHYTVTTNGTLFTPEMVRKLRAVNMHVIVSLDGLQEANLARVMHNGQESFSLVDQGLRLLQEEGVGCSIASVLFEQNFDLLGVDFLEYLKARSINQWEIKLGMQNDGAVARSAEDYAGKLMSLYNYGKLMGIAISGDWYDAINVLFHTTRRKDDIRTDRLAANSCSATDHQVSVEPSGNVFGCRALETKVGDISELENLFSGAAYKNLAMRTYSNVPACKGCKIEGLCQGVCIGHSEKNFQDIYQPDNKYCDVYRAMFDLVLGSGCGGQE
jgi:uncharacterized protein